MSYRPLAERRDARRRRVDGARPSTGGPRAGARTGATRRTWTRVARHRADAIASRLSSAAAGALAAGWAALVGLLAVGLVVILGWVLGAGTGDIVPALRFVGLAWLGAHHIPIAFDDGGVSLLGLGFLIVPGVVLWRAGRWAARRSAACRWRDVRTATGFAAGVYATLALVVATVSGTGAARVGPLAALLGAVAVALITFGASFSREAGLWPTIGVRVAQPVRIWFRAAGAALLTITAGVAGLLAVSLVFSFPRARELTEALDPGFTGAVLLLVLSLAYLPNLIGWGFGYVTGAGISVGGGAMVSPGSAGEGGALPAFPLLAAIPDAAEPWRFVVLVVPLVAGVVAGLILHPVQPGSLRNGPDWRARGWVAALVFVAVALFAALSGGSLGSNRLSDLGPPALTTAIASALLVTVGSVAGDVVRLMRRRRRGLGRVEVDLRTADGVHGAGSKGDGSATGWRHRIGRRGGSGAA